MSRSFSISNQPILNRNLPTCPIIRQWVPLCYFPIAYCFHHHGQKFINDFHRVRNVVDFSRVGFLYPRHWNAFLIEDDFFIFSIFPAQITAAVTPSPAAPPPVQQPAPPPDNNEQQPAQNMQMNAAGRVEDNDEDLGVRRDWLDWIYVVIRTLMLFFILYFYSSFGRLMIVMGVTALLYL